MNFESKGFRWTGWILTGLFVAFMVVDLGVKYSGNPIVYDAMNALGYGANTLMPVTIIETVCLVLYLVPRTSILGAVLFMGVLGGAVTSHMRVGDPLVTHTLFGVFVGIVMWGGLWLRDPALRALFPLRRSQHI